MVVKYNPFCRIVLVEVTSNILVVGNPISPWIFFPFDVGENTPYIHQNCLDCVSH